MKFQSGQGSIFSKFLAFVLYLTFMLLPLLNYGGVFEGIKIAGLWLIGLVSIIYLVYVFLSKHELILSALNISDRYFLLWIVIAILSGIFGIHPLDSIIGGSYRHQGILFFLSLYFLSLIFRLFRSKSADVAIVLSVSVFLQSVIVLIQWLFKLQGSLINGRAIGTFGEPNATAGFLAVEFWFFLRFIQKRDIHVFWRVFGISIIIFAILATGSRTGLIVAVYFFLMFLVLHYKKFISVFQSAVYLFLFIVIGGTVLMFFSTKQESLVENRAVLWSLGVKGVFERPILGYGLESGEALYDSLFRRHTIITLSDFMVDRSHNLFLDIAHWTGLIGLGVFLTWIFTLIKKWFKNKDHFRLVGLLGWFLFACFQPVGVVLWLLFFLLIFV